MSTDSGNSVSESRQRGFIGRDISIRNAISVEKCVGVMKIHTWTGDDGEADINVSRVVHGRG